MADQTIRPSMKTVWPAYLIAFIVCATGVWAWYTYEPNEPAWVASFALLAFLPPLKMHIRRRLITLRLHDGHLTIESGFFSRTRRTVDMAKIQDVTVRQTLGQRMLGIGDLRLESAGESGAMGISSVDGPRAIADTILAQAQKAINARTQGLV